MAQLFFFSRFCIADRREDEMEITQRPEIRLKIDKIGDENETLTGGNEPEKRNLVDLPIESQRCKKNLSDTSITSEKEEDDFIEMGRGTPQIKKDTELDHYPKSKAKASPHPKSKASPHPNPKASPHLSPNLTPQANSDKKNAISNLPNQNDSHSGTHSQTQSNFNNTHTQGVIGIPCHDASKIPKKEVKENDNDALNYTMTQNKATLINQIKKARYGFIDDYDILQADKKLSKRKIEVEYDQNVVYGMPSNYRELKETIKQEQEQEQADSYKDDLGIEIKVKNNSKKTEYSNQQEKRQMNSKNNLRIKIDEDAIPEVNQNKEDDHKKQKTKRTKRNEGQKQSEMMLNNNNSSAQEALWKTLPNSHNKNFQAYFNATTDNLTQKQQNQYSGYHAHNHNSSFISANDNQNQVQNNNLNYSFLSTLSGKKDQGQGGNNSNINGNDQFSCENCEGVYKLCILHNYPLKILKCLICGNVINNTSLEFYLNKYKNELVKHRMELLKKPERPKKEIEKETKKIEKDSTPVVIEPKVEVEGKQTEVPKISADEGGLSENWGNWIDTKKQTVRDKLFYEPIIIKNPRKNKKEEKEKEAHAQAEAHINPEDEKLNKIEQNDVPLSDAFLKKKAELAERIEKRKKKQETNIKATDILPKVDVDLASLTKKHIEKREIRETTVVESHNVIVSESINSTTEKVIHREKVEMSSKEKKEVNEEIVKKVPENYSEKKKQAEVKREENAKRREKLALFTKKLQEDAKKTIK